MAQILKEIVQQFQFQGDFVSAEPWGSGLIHNTYLVHSSSNGVPGRYILQNINRPIFSRPDALMKNIVRVTSHLRRKLIDSGVKNVSRHCLQLVPTIDGRFFIESRDMGFWRSYEFIENAVSYDMVQSLDQASGAAAAFGRFHKLLLDLSFERLTDILPDFHHTAKRFETFETAVAEDPVQRLDSCRKEVSFAMDRKSMASVVTDLMDSGGVPVRVVHNDTKLNNVLFDKTTGEAICVIDLDTVMAGSVLFDFGDMVRSMVCGAPEDERDTDRVNIRMPVFQAVLDGYLGETIAFLTETELNHFVFSTRLIAFELGLRFLTDFLTGDTYFKAEYESHNLDRCRTQFRLVESFETHETEMMRLFNVAIGKLSSHHDPLNYSA